MRWAPKNENDKSSVLITTLAITGMMFMSADVIGILNIQGLVRTTLNIQTLYICLAGPTTNWAAIIYVSF